MQIRPKRSGPGYSILAFANRLGCSWRFVERMVRNGEVRAVTLGGRTIIPEAELPRLRGVLGITDVPAETKAPPPTAAAN